MDVSEIVSEVKKLNLKPSEVFGKAALLEDYVVADELGRLLIKIDDIQADLTQSKAELQRAKSRETFDAVVESRGLLEMQAKYVERNWSTFTTSATDEAGLRKDVEAFVDRHVAEFMSLQSDIGLGLANPLIPSNKPKEPSDNPLVPSDEKEEASDNPLVPDDKPAPITNPLRFDYVAPEKLKDNPLIPA